MQKLYILLILSVTGCTPQYRATYSDTNMRFGSGPKFDYGQHQYGTELQAIDQDLKRIDTRDGMHDAERVYLEEFRNALINKENSECRTTLSLTGQCNQ